MDKTALATAAAATLAISTAGAENLPPPMGIMGPYDTPAMAAERITLPEDAGALAAQRGEAGLENANAAPPENAGLLDLTGSGHAPGNVDGMRELAERDREDKDEDKDEGDKDDGDGDGDTDDGDKDDGDKDDGDKDDGDKDDDKDDGDKDDGDKDDDKDDGDKDDGDKDGDG